MAQHVWTVLCDKVLVDSEPPATVSLVQVIERLILRAPANQSLEDMVQEAQEAGDKGILVNVNMKLVTWWVRSDYSTPEMLRFRHALINPSGVRIDEQMWPLNLLEPVSNRAVVKISEFPLSALGLHWIVIEEERAQEGRGGTDWWPVARIPLEVVEEMRSDS